MVARLTRPTRPVYGAARVRRGEFANAVFAGTLIGWRYPMIRTLLATIALTMVTLFGSVRPALADTKVAYVDVDLVVAESTWGKQQVAQAMKDAEAKMEPLKKEMQGLEKEASDLDKKGLKPDELKKKQLDLALKKMDVARKMEKAEQEAAQAVAKAREKAAARVKVVAATLAQEGKYDYCLDARVVLSGPKGSDLTEATKKRIDAK